MKLTYYGHASFLLESDGTAILIDPFDERVGYPQPDVAPAAVTVSHEHGDHNHVATAKGGPKVIRGLTAGGKDWNTVHERVGPVTITGIATYHDTSQGQDRGKNTIFVFEAENLRVAHAGDLGHPLNDAQVSQVGKIDVLMLPIGGHFTIGPKEAELVVDQVQPRVVIPMHYKTEVNKDWPIGPPEPFTDQKAPKQKARQVEVTAATLPAGREVWVLRHT